MDESSKMEMYEIYCEFEKMYGSIEYLEEAEENYIKCVSVFVD